MTDRKIDRRDLPFDVVNKAKHYNSHPSGVEVKEVTNYLEFNLANVYKYAIRYADKEPVRSLKSAMWYLEEHRTVWVGASELFVQSHRTLMQTGEWGLMFHNLKKVVDAEPDPLVKYFLTMYRSYIGDGYPAKHFFDMRGRLRALIDRAVIQYPAQPPAAAPEPDTLVTKAMLDRFLSWKLPTDFCPDAGISFKADYNEGTPWPMKHEPIGTNLLNAEQAKKMLDYVVDGKTS